MWNKIKKEFYFGEEVKGYDVRVLNERGVRAASGILFLFSISMFFIGCVGGNLLAIKIFGTYFFIEFLIRVLVNPKYAPAMILGRWFVNNQKPEYVGAPQKRFAWSIGLFLGLVFFLSVLVFGVIGIWNVILCFICMAFLFFESAFGICAGCKIYEKFLNKESYYCPGGTCEVHIKEKIQEISLLEWMILVIAVLGIVFTALFFSKVDLKKDCTFKNNTQLNLKNDSNNLLEGGCIFNN